MMYCQVRPLLVVTENEEKLAHKEHELRQVTDRYDKLRQDHDDLTRQHALVTDEKATLSEQLRSEAEMSAEAEEVRYLLPKIVFDQLLIISTKVHNTGSSFLNCRVIVVALVDPEKGTIAIRQ